MAAQLLDDIANGIFNTSQPLPVVLVADQLYF